MHKFSSHDFHDEIRESRNLKESVGIVWGNLCDMAFISCFTKSASSSKYYEGENTRQANSSEIEREG
jgi:hypothetical protein